MEARVNLNVEGQSDLKSDVRLSKANYEFDVFGDIWRLDASTSLNLRLLDGLNLTPKFKECFRLALADYACELSANYTSNLFRFSRWLFDVGVIHQIEEVHIINFKAKLDKDSEYKLGYIRAFILDWHEKGLGGVDSKVVELLNSLTLSGNEKGKAVALGCPYSGAYTFDEQDAFIRWYVDAYTKNTISLSEYAFIMALQQTGARPTQIRYLYFGDLLSRSEDGFEYFDLNLPNIKKRNKGIRESFQLKENIGEDLALVLSAQGRESVCAVEKHFSFKLCDEQKKLIPLFLRQDKLEETNFIGEFFEKMSRNPDFYCFTRSNTNVVIQKIARLCYLKTNRIIDDGKPGDLHINPRRFRYTHATNLAILGASDLVIAEELGHEDTQNVKVYTEFNEDIADVIDEALAPTLVPLSQAFHGTLIDNEKDAIRVNDPRSRIHINSGEPVGNCGKFGFCANGSTHCYTCNKFQPWLNAPHKEVLAGVVAERDRKQKMGASEFVLHAQNRTIEAIKVVILQCEERKRQQNSEGVIDV